MSEDELKRIIDKLLDDSELKNLVSWTEKKNWMVIYTSAKYASSIIDMTVTNVVNIPIVANVRNIKCEIAEKF